MLINFSEAVQFYIRFIILQVRKDFVIFNDESRINHVFKGFWTFSIFR